MSNSGVPLPAGGVGETVQLDLTNPDHHRFASDLLARSGSSDRLPQPGAGAASDTRALPWLSIPYLFTWNGTHFHSRAIALLPWKVARATLILTLYDLKTQSQFASSSVSQDHGLFLTDGVSGDLPEAESDGVNALATLYVFMPADPIPRVYTTRRTWTPRHAEESVAAVAGAGTATVPVAVSACQLAPAYASTTPGTCVNDGQVGNPIQICVGSGTGCDYVVPAGQNIFGPPASGTATFSSAVQAPLSGSCVVAFEAGGPTLAYNFDLATSGWFQASGNEVSWQIPATAFPVSGSPTGLFQYALILQTTLAGGDLAVVVFASANTGPLPGVFAVPPLMRNQS